MALNPGDDLLTPEPSSQDYSPYLQDHDPQGLDFPTACLACGSCFVLVYLLVVLIDNLPFALLQPVWQINFFVSLVDNALYALIGLLLLAFAARLDQTIVGPAKFFRGCSRLAVAASIGFLLLIPSLLLATRQSESVLFTANAQRVEIARSRLDQFRSRVASARSTQEIEALLKAEQGISLSSEDLKRPVDSLRQGLISRLDEARRQLPNTKIAQLNWRWSALQRSLRISLMALCYAIAFAALGQRRKAADSFLIELISGFHANRMALLMAMQDRSERSQSARSFREEILRTRRTQEQRYLQDQHDRAMAEHFEASLADQREAEPSDRQHAEERDPWPSP